VPFSTGDKIGPFQIVGLLGKGGMGEVYRARDPRLERDVAIKVLPTAVSSNRERLTRFEREAKMLAALNHPNIATIYGLEAMSGGAQAIVMELIEGPTLEDRLKAGPLPLEEALTIAEQVIAAVEAAHEKGVVHRDLKPANIKAPLDRDSAVKVLDFGLATVVQSSGSEPIDASESPTLTMGATASEVILGTAGYMSPEQAAGKKADKRADIWSFGVVLWEMLTGERLFAGGQTVSHILADVLRAPVDFEKIPGGAVRELLRRCLDRDVRTRLRDIGEARVALSQVDRVSPFDPALPRSATANPVLQRGGRIFWPFATTVMTLVAAVAGWIAWHGTQLEEKPLHHLVVDLGADVMLNQLPAGDVVISPDGTRLVYLGSPAVAPENGPVASSGRGSQTRGGINPRRSRLFIRRLDQINQSKSVELSGTEGAQRPFFSPDNKWVGFFYRNKLHKISVEGGPVVDLGAEGNEGNWGEDGTILVGTVPNSGVVQKIPDSGGEGVKIPGLPANIGFFDPQILPGGKAGLFTTEDDASAGSRQYAIEAVSFADGRRKVLVRDAYNARYFPTGHLTYVRDGTLFAILFSPEKLETHGASAPILENVWRNVGSGVALSFSRNGTLVYRAAADQDEDNGEATIDWIDAEGKRSPLLPTPGPYADLHFSPDGNQLGYSTRGSSSDVWTYDMLRAVPTKLSFDGLSRDAIWSRPDGRYVLFSRLLGSADGGIFWTRAGGGQPQRLVVGKPGEIFAGAALSFSPDGKVLTGMFAPENELRSGQNRVRGPYVGGVSLSAVKIFTATVTEENGQLKAGTPTPFSPTEFGEAFPAFSPDGRWIAFVTNRSGRGTVVRVREFPPPASGQPFEIQVSDGVAREPRWSPNSRELLYSTPSQIMAVPYTIEGGQFKPGRPRVRVDKFGGNDWDVAPDGRIAVVTRLESLEAPREHMVVFVENFFDELKRRVK
jgi:serine/threonine-protein kinase